MTPDFRTLTDADWKRELPRARAYRNEVQSEIRERLARLSNTPHFHHEKLHKTNKEPKVEEKDGFILVKSDSRRPE
jgi:hypothetical protein